MPWFPVKGFPLIIIPPPNPVPNVISTDISFPFILPNLLSANAATVASFSTNISNSGNVDFNFETNSTSNHPRFTQVTIPSLFIKLGTPNPIDLISFLLIWL